VGRRLLLVVAVICVLLLAGATLRLFVWPPSAAVPAKADAVALLSGGAGDRLPKAKALMARGVAPVLVISNGHDPKWTAANRLCDTPQPYRVVCPDPHPNTTRGEAEVIGRMAGQLAWRHVVVVTSRYHITRARLLLGRCLHGGLAVVASTPRAGVLSWTADVAHEWGGLADAVAIHRGC